MIHANSIIYMADKKPNEEHSITFYDRHGDEIIIDKCVITSTSFKHKTINVKCLPANQVRTLRLFSIVKLNGKEVYR